MRFVLVDRIHEIKRGESLVASKNLTLGEEYLADHFPTFPVMPGVLMLEALTQTGAWLIRDSEDFAHSIILLKRARAIKYGSFVEPGNQLKLQVDLVSMDARDCEMKGRGLVDGQVVVSGRLTLERFNLRDQNPGLHRTDTLIVESLRDLFGTLREGSVGARAQDRNGQLGEPGSVPHP